MQLCQDSENNKFVILSDRENVQLNIMKYENLNAVTLLHEKDPRI